MYLEDSDYSRKGSKDSELIQFNISHGGDQDKECI